MEDDKSGWHWSPWFKIMYGKIPVGVILVVILIVGLKAAGLY